MFNAQEVKRDFPILNRTVHEKPLVYLDNAATSQKPNVVIDAISDYYREHNANVHRGVHVLGDESTRLFHHSRQSVADFFGAQKEELLIVRNTTEAINQVAYTWGENNIVEGDVILATELEHHSDLVPWQMLAQKKNAKVEYIPVTETGMLNLEWLQNYDFKQNPVKLLAFSHVSNTLGTLAPVTEIVELIRKHSPRTKILIDGAQAAPHLPITFDDMNVDFYVMSAHKMMGPMGIGGLLIKREVLQTLPPFLYGGGMIAEVSLETTTFIDDLEERFTAGTPDVASLVGWAAACKYLQHLGMQNVYHHDHELVAYALEKLSQVEAVKIIGPTDPKDRVGSVTFSYQGVHAHDVGQVLDSEGIAVRSGHHCTMPLHTKLGLAASIRVSFNVYNTTEDIDALVTALNKVKKVFGQ